MLPSFTILWLWWLYEGCCFFPDQASAIKSLPGKKHLFSASDTQDRLPTLTASVSTMFPNLRSHAVLAGLHSPGLVYRQTHGLVAQKPGLQITPSPHVCLAPPFCCQPQLTASFLYPHGVSCQNATGSVPKKPHSLKGSFNFKQHLRLWRKGLLIQWRLTYICKVLAIGASLSIAHVPNLLPTAKYRALVCSTSVDSSSHAVTLTQLLGCCYNRFVFSSDSTLPLLHKER